ncbi:MAG: EamA family transporter [Sphingomonadales bacterium CG12_big_fil_rev_8_21_14_0_65_65_10]|nr:MAG: EamA family transporter [Sphingomonadales bacterium CG12_big_fil_rev_8_21_14_0_65_65_10]
MPVLAALAGVACLSLMDAFMKGAALAIGAYSAAVLRYGIGFAVAAPVWLAAGGRWPAREPLRFHLIRGVISAFMALTFFYALTKLPIAETIAISFFAPILSLYLAALLLKEQIRREAIWAALLGLAGTLVIVGGRIGRERMTEDAALGLAAITFSALLYAYNLVLGRQQALVAKPLEIATFHSGIGGLVLAFGAPWFLVLPDAAVTGDLAAAALLTVVGAAALAWGYAREEAQVLVPMEYSGFLWASLFGWLFFREAVPLTTISGVLLIVAGCWIATRRKRPEIGAI